MNPLRTGSGCLAASSLGIARRAAKIVHRVQHSYATRRPVVPVVLSCPVDSAGTIIAISCGLPPEVTMPLYRAASLLLYSLLYLAVVRALAMAMLA